MTITHFFTCDSCNHAKTMRRAIQPEWPGLRTTSFGEERVWVHNSKGTKLGACGIMGHWVGYDRDSSHVHQIYWLEKHSTSVKCNVKLTTDALIVLRHQPTPVPPHQQPQLSQGRHSQQRLPHHMTAGTSRQSRPACQTVVQVSHLDQPPLTTKLSR
jgi:hypothetical protein